MKAFYQELDVEVITFVSEDVIATSGGATGGVSGNVNDDGTGDNDYSGDDY